MKLRERGFSGTLSPAESDRERRHRAIARRAAAEGMVLLKNDGVLPLAPHSRVAIYGGGARYTIKGGTGSGAVNNRSNVTIDEGMRGAGFTVTNGAWLDDYDARYARATEEWFRLLYDLSAPGDFDSLYRAHASHPLIMPQGAPIAKEPDTDTAIYVISRVSGEGADRKAEPGDYYLTDAEREELGRVAALYPKTVVVLNVGGIIDTGFVDEFSVGALLLMSQAGMEGGAALADVLSGKVDPCGRLTDTWALHYGDYPSSAAFSHNNGNLIEEKYTEGIYVGYRYFDSFGVQCRYPFGFGLSYTSFSMETEEVRIRENEIAIAVRVTNEGERTGREVVLVYVSCPQGELVKEQKRLVGFAKTASLAPGASERLCISFALPLLASYHAGRHAYLLEKGDYFVLVGENAGQVTPAAVLKLSGTVETQVLQNICPLLDALRQIQPPQGAADLWRRKMSEDAAAGGAPRLNIDAAALDARAHEAGVLEENAKKMEPGCAAGDGEALAILGQLTRGQKTALVCGRPKAGHAEFIGNAAVTVPGAAGETTAILREPYGVGNMVLADGPAGLRLLKHYEENPADGSVYGMTRYESLENRIFGKEFPHEGAVSHYQFASAIPVGTLLAQTFDLALMEEVGRLIGCEMEEFGVTLWLAPGMNIHRNPLCGRNFEYYSEDPLVSGRMAAALTRGVQSFGGLGTTIKHFACNNQEENRRGVSSIVSERALREIYLKGFELCVREAQPMAIMTSYNKVNGVHTANSYDLCTVAARREWGFEGIIMTDWTTTNADGGSSAAKCISAGNDLIMPGTASDIREILDALDGAKDQYLEEEKLDGCALRMLRVILASGVYEDALPYASDASGERV